MARKVKGQHRDFLQAILDIHDSDPASLYVSDAQIVNELGLDFQEVQRLLEAMCDEGYVKLYGKRSKGFKVELHSWVKMEL